MKIFSKIFVLGMLLSPNLMAYSNFCEVNPKLCAASNPGVVIVDPTPIMPNVILRNDAPCALNAVGYRSCGKKWSHRGYHHGHHHRHHGYHHRHHGHR